MKSMGGRIAMVKKEATHVRLNPMNRRNGIGMDIPEFVSPKAAQTAQAFHRTFPDYQPTPLVGLPGLAAKLGIRQLLVKDESHRFGLNAFKVLGASYAMARYLCERLGISIEEADFTYMRSEEVKRQLGELTFVTATDGNHGRAVAWAAAQLGQKAVVYLPKGSASQRVEAIRQTGAHAHVINGNYDEAVRLSDQMARERGWQVIQDTAWEGYTDIPAWIMQGYTTMAAEALQQIAEQFPEETPTHLFLQAGVGSMAAAVLGYVVARNPSKYPFTIIVEPHAADCFYRSAAGDGRALPAMGDLRTIMAGLACGEPSPLAWEILRDYADAFASCPDSVAADGMRSLGLPSGVDQAIVSGESGAVGVGLLETLMQQAEWEDFRKTAKLDETSVVLCFSTEGDTDRESYEQIVRSDAKTKGEG
ncbi:MAG TPA: diaminopropionate ammonia-lyase [Brevibacillus sp.]|nr:diaminopropionate ammonia-lyase [Brevibacillus sp.]